MMHDTLIVQSHRSPLPYPWIERCLESVRAWCGLRGYAYRFMGDELFETVAGDLLDKTRHQRVIASDLARLYALKAILDEGYQTAVWLDADFLIFNPTAFELPDTPYAVGREVWVQAHGQGRLKVYKKVHNAFLMFRRGNSFLDFYAETAERLLRQNQGSVPPQFIGPKLLTALHNIVGLPVLETAGMLSPAVIKDVIRGRGPALAQYRQRVSLAAHGANLCASSCDSQAISSDEMHELIDRLMT